MRRNNITLVIIGLLCIVHLESYSQATSGGTAATPNRPNVAGTDYIGWDNTVAVPLMLKCNNTYSPGTVNPSIQFWISGTQYMWLDGNSKNLAVGSSVNVTPPYKLTVESDVDVECQNTTTPPWNEGYRYNGYLILNAPVSAQNICVGYGSGINTTGTDNSFLGLSSGQTNSTGQSNTFLGSNAGFSNDQANDNTFTGSFAGFSNSDGEKNVFTGSESAALNVSGEENVITGYQAGYNNDGSKNVLIGAQAGFTTTNLGEFTAVGRLKENGLY